MIDIYILFLRDEENFVRVLLQNNKNLLRSLACLSSLVVYAGKKRKRKKKEQRTRLFFFPFLFRLVTFYLAL